MVQIPTRIQNTHTREIKINKSTKRKDKQQVMGERESEEMKEKHHPSLEGGMVHCV